MEEFKQIIETLKTEKNFNSLENDIYDKFFNTFKGLDNLGQLEYLKILISVHDDKELKKGNFEKLFSNDWVKKILSDYIDNE